MSRPIALPRFLSERVERDARALAASRGAAVDFEKPAGEPALVGPDSVSWQVFRNPVTLFVGVLVSVFQAITQVQEMTLTFVPKLLGVAAVLVVMGTWMLTTLVAFTHRCFEMMGRVGG